MRISFLAIALAPIAFAAMPAQAQQTDSYASGAILRGDYVKAEKRLVAKLNAQPRLPEAQLNLAAVFAHTGRDDEARALYADVLAQDPVLMDLPDEQVVSSHALAKAGLRRLDQPMQVGAR